MSYYHPIPEKNTVIDRVLKGIVDAVAVGMFALFLCMQFGHAEKIEGDSMEGVLRNGEQVLVNQIIYKIAAPDRYDIIAFTKNDHVYVKRVVGLPGDTIEMKDGHLVINGEAVSYNSKAEGMIYEGICEDAQVTLESGSYFVLGDNWNASEDSRSVSIGKVDKSEIIGRVWFRISPVKEAGFIDHTPGEGEPETTSAKLDDE